MDVCMDFLTDVLEICGVFLSPTFRPPVTTLVEPAGEVV